MKEAKFIKSMETLNIKDGDILVVKIDRELDSQMYHNFSKAMESHLPEKLKDIKVLVLTPSVDLGVVRKEAE